MRLATRNAARLLPLVVLLLAITPPASTCASGQVSAADPVPGPVADARLTHLGKLLRTSAATNDKVIAALGAVEEAYVSYGGDARRRNAYRKKAGVQLAKALTRWKSARGTKHPNLHEASVVRAAEVIGRLASVLDAKGRTSLAGKVRTALESRVLERHDADEISQAQLDATFAALGHLNAHDVLPHVLGHAAHTRWRDVRTLRAALASLVLFRDVPGRDRREVFKSLLQVFSGVEAVAERSSNAPGDLAKKRFWDEVRLAVIPAVQHVAGAPTNAKGEALATMAEFQAWWRAHKSPRRAPWRDA